MHKKVFGLINFVLIIFALIINFNLRLDYHFCPDTQMQELEICKDDNDFHDQNDCHLCYFHKLDNSQDCDCQKKEIAIYFSIPATLSVVENSFISDFVFVFNFCFQNIFKEENNQNKNHFFEYKKHLSSKDILIENQVFRI